EERHGYRILRAEGASVPNTLAAVLFHLRDVTGTIPHAYFSWTEGKPLVEVLRFLFFGEGDVAPVTHEIIRGAEPDPERRPVIHVAWPSFRTMSCGGPRGPSAATQDDSISTSRRAISSASPGSSVCVLTVTSSAVEPT